MRSTVILAFDGVQLLDIAGPAAVMAEATEIVGSRTSGVTVASVAGGVVRTSGGIGLATGPVAEIAPDSVDTLLVPGGLETALLGVIADPVASAWISACSVRVRRLASVCTGAFVLASLGLLKGRTVATHWAAAEAFRLRFPELKLNDQALFVRDGAVWTSAGVSTGIDMTLAMVEQDHGREVAAKVARRLVLQSRRPGHQAQFSALLDAQAGRYADLVDWIDVNLGADLSTEALAARAGQAPRTFHRNFRAATGLGPAAFVTRRRLEHARNLLGGRNRRQGGGASLRLHLAGSPGPGLQAQPGLDPVRLSPAARRLT